MVKSTAAAGRAPSNITASAAAPSMVDRKAIMSSSLVIFLPR
jgi:hypothetical protein